jgi:hypothetical protein
MRLEWGREGECCYQGSKEEQLKGELIDKLKRKFDPQMKFLFLSQAIVKP